jgi:hypothetical protein
MQKAKALTLGLMLAAAAALLPQNASARPWGWHGGWHHGGGWGWGAAALGTGLAVGALATAPYYYGGYAAYPYGYGYPDYAYGYGYPGYYDYGYQVYPRCYYRGYVRVCH